MKRSLSLCSTAIKIDVIVNTLQKHGINGVKFVGQKKGLHSEGQKQTIQEFREGKFNVLVASSIGEEGLEYPLCWYCDLLWAHRFRDPHNPAPRKSRQDARWQGDCADDKKTPKMKAFYWLAKRKESRMHKIISGYSGKTVKAKQKRRKKGKGTRKERQCRKQNRGKDRRKKGKQRDC